LRSRSARDARCARGSSSPRSNVESPADTTFGRAFTHGSLQRPEVALTFDDGPNPPYTERILAELQRLHAHATFFVVGRAVEAHPQTLRAIVAAGNAVGAHGWDHAHMLLESDATLVAEVAKTERAIAQALGRTTWLGRGLVRPPFGQRGPSTFSTLRSRGETPVLWSVPLSDDWTQPGVATIVARSTRAVENGAIIVLHDGDRGRNCAPHDRSCDRAQDAPATREIIERLRARGFRFVTIPEMLGRATLDQATRP
jgi:peptidoglycan/xylan/chitin deacetylase (PgdA/CDA1 family)